MINLMIIYDVVNIFSMKNYKSSRKLGVGLNESGTIGRWDNWPVTFWGVGQLAGDFLKVVLILF